jgi:hypothetical protein
MKKQVSQLPIILAKDEAAINDFRQRLEDLFPSVAQMVDHYFRFPFALQSATPGSIFSNTPSQAENYKATNLPESMNVAGMTLDRNRFAKFMTIPGMDEFQAARDRIIAKNGETLLSYFKIVDKLPEIDEAKFSLYADAHSIMARTETDKQLYAAWVRMIAGLTEFNDLVKFNFIFLSGLTAPKLGVFLKEDKQGKIVPSPTLFEAIAKQLNKKHEDMQ